VDKDTRSFEEVFAEQRDRLVYLTADSETELDVLSTDDIYIIGASGFPSGCCNCQKTLCQGARLQTCLRLRTWHVNQRHHRGSADASAELMVA